MTKRRELACDAFRREAQRQPRARADVQHVLQLLLLVADVLLELGVPPCEAEVIKEANKVRVFIFEIIISNNHYLYNCYFSHISIYVQLLCFPFSEKCREISTNFIKIKRKFG